MATTVVPPAGASMPAATTSSSLIMSDLGISSSSSSSSTPTPAAATNDDKTAESVDPAVAEAIAAIPDDDAAETAGELGDEQPPEAEAAEPAVEDDSVKPEIPNLSESRWQRVHNGYKWAQEVGKALGVVGEDGRVDVTLFPSVEEVKGMRTAYSDRIAMEHDFASADPENSTTFITNWNQFSPEGMTTLAATLPNVLATQNQQAYQQMAAPVLGRFLDFMYKAPAVEDPALRARLLDAARMTEWWLNGMPDQGGYRSDQEIQLTPQRAEQTSPREANLAAREARLRQIEDRAVKEQWGGFSGAVNSQIKAGLDAEIDAALAPIKPLYPNALNYEALRDKFVSQFRQALGNDTMGKRQWDIAVERVQRSSRNEADRDALVQQYLGMAKRALHAVRGKFITEASKGIKAASDARHQALGKSAAKTGPTNAGAPRPQSIRPAIMRDKNETQSDYQRRMIQADLGL